MTSKFGINVSFLILSLVLYSCASTHTYNFLVTNRECNCSEYSITDKKNGITYKFTASYSLEDEMLTTITMTVRNGSSKVLSFDQARVKVSSKRFPYRYNDKFVPFTAIELRPGETRAITLVGRAEITARPGWHRIAGEEMTVTIRGVRLGDNELSLEELHFVPVNPKLGSD